MNYTETVEYLYNQSPDFQKVGKKAYKPGLGNALVLDQLLGAPHRHFASIHVAGTNGKGSTSHMLAAILQQAGYKVGLYTSPHLLDFRERIRVNGEPIAEHEVVDFVQHYKPDIERIQPSFFELTASMAFWYFALQRVDIAVVEVGLGGRLDATNVIVPVLSVITNISIDHTDLLGHTLEQIAAEKAGIIKQGVPVVLGQRQEATFHVFEQAAAAAQAPLVVASARWAVTSQRLIGGYQQFTLAGTGGALSLSVDLLGSYQRYNVPTVLAAVELLCQGGWRISDTDIVQALPYAATTTGLGGRWQQVRQNPTVICDIAHNVDGITQVVQQLATSQYQSLHVVFGMVADKEVDKVLALLPKNAHYYFTQASGSRAMPSLLLVQKALALGLQGRVVPQVSEAIDLAFSEASEADMVYIGGSTFVVAEALHHFAQ